MLEAPKEGDWEVRLEPRFIDLVTKDFNNVRVPVRWSNHASPDGAAVIDVFFANRVDGVVDSLLKKNVYVILNMHHYNQIFGDQLHKGEFEVAPEVVEKRFVNMWRQIAVRYKNRSPKLIFELLNEPHGTLDSDKWNRLFAETLAAVREVDPKRIVMGGPTYWNAPKDLSKLKLPKDQNLIVQFHSYLPFNFTHQGVTWLPMNLPLGVTCCDVKQRSEIASDIELANQWSRAAGYPVYLGEFGAIKEGDNKSRAEYARFVRETAESKGISWAYWEFASGFGIFDPNTSTWNPQMRRALLDK
jgi:endoglucanase